MIDNGGVSTRRTLARLLCVAAVGAAPVPVLPGAFAAPAPAGPAPAGDSGVGPVSIQAPDGYHGSVTVTVPGCDFQTWQVPTLTRVHLGGETYEAASDAQSPAPGGVTVPVDTFGTPGSEVSISAECEVDTRECPPEAATCLGPALMSIPAQRWQIPFPGYLAPGEVLDAQNPSVSTGPDGTGARLTVTESGNLVQTAADGRVLWSSGTTGADVQLRAQKDGNVVLYADATTIPKPLWATWTQGHPGARLTLHEEGGFAVYSTGGVRLWTSEGARPAPAPPQLDELPAPGALTAGDRLVSADRGTTLVMQQDGNLVVYGGTGNRARWHTRTHGNPGARLRLQSDGNLVVYSREDKPLWNSGTRGAQRLTVQDDGNIVLYSPANTPLWHTATFHQAAGARRHVGHGAR